MRASAEAGISLRFDDTDHERSRREYADAIETDLAWLGVAPDLVRRQSERVALYDAAAARLRAMGRLYACYETAEELERRRKRQQALGRPPIYDRASLRLTDAERAALEAEGRKPHWRFRLEPITVRWNDLARGEAASTPPRSPIRFCSARTGPISTP